MAELTNEDAVPARATRREWIGLAVLTLAALVYAMDLTVLNLAIPIISEELRPSSVQLLWMIDIYGFLVAGLLITMGTLGDRIGRRRLLLFGAAGFAAASLLAAFSTSSEMLIASRAVMGIAGATIAPSTLSLIFTMFLDTRALDRHRRLDRRLLGRWCHRPRSRRRAPRVLLVGVGVPHRRTGHGPPAHPRTAHPARVPGPERALVGPRQRGAVALASSASCTG